MSGREVFESPDYPGEYYTIPDGDEATGGEIVEYLVKQNVR